MFLVTCPECACLLQAMTANREKWVQCGQCSCQFVVTDDMAMLPTFISDLSPDGALPRQPLDPQRTFATGDLNEQAPLTFSETYHERFSPTPPEDPPAPASQLAAPASVPAAQQVAATPSPVPTVSPTATQPTVPAPSESAPLGFGRTFGNAQQDALDDSHINYELTDFEKKVLGRESWKEVVEILAWSALAIGGLILIMGSLPKGFLLDAGHDKRFLIALFMAAVSGASFIVTLEDRAKAIFLAVAGAVVLLNLAFWLPIYVTPAKNGAETVKTFSLGPIKNEPRFPPAPKLKL